MSRLTLLAAILAALTVACGGKNDKTGKNDNDKQDHAGHEHTDSDDGGHDHDHEAGDGDGDAHNGPSKIDEAMEGLSEADRKLARAQGTCPVSDEALGNMGTPIKLEVKGKTVFLCCPGCKKKILKAPDKYLAKLK